ncbi:hypothetical protein SDC9_51420 [bioreactor metagenome]|uniref:Uncharacterized protein n=1 Tax=bioreactor metagenome TaxID=1076179 RepID=A0A644WSC3_9ZZZZ
MSLTNIKINIKILLSVIIASILIFEGCASNTQQVTPSQSVSPSESEPESSFPSLNPVALSLPTAEMFGLEGMEAALFNGALEGMPRNETNEMRLPHVSIYGQYEANDETIVICNVLYQTFYDYYGPEHKVTRGRAAFLVCMVLKPLDDGGYQCISFEEAGDDLGYVQNVKDFCGPLTELAQQILKDEAETTSNFPEPDEMLNMYCEATGVIFN